MKNENTDEPALAPPGAGLPFGQRVFAKALVGPILSKVVPLSRARADYEKHTSQIISLVSKLPAESRKTRILVPPIGGLEDSSRNWSLNGVLEHLLTVSQGMERVIMSLGKEVVPPGSADPAKVKPQHPDQEYLNEFITYAPGLLARIDDAVSAKAIHLDSRATFPHTWFGRMNARQWYWLLSRHQGIHAKQASLIAASAAV